MGWMQIYFEFTGRLFIFFTMELFASYKSNNYTESKKKTLRLCYMAFNVIYAILTNLPGIFILVVISDFLYFYLIGNQKFKTCLFTFLKFVIYIFISFCFLFILNSLIINDFYFLNYNITYSMSKRLICKCLVYIVLCLYIYGKRLSSLRESRHYGILFSVITIISCLLLSHFALQLICGQLNSDTTLPLVFSFVFIAIALCLSSYQQIVSSLETNMNQKLLLMRYETEQDYYKDIEKSLNTISSLRHDFRNHLIILDDYAKKNDYDNFHAYLSKISSELEDTRLIQTPSSLVSAILNTKANVCQEKHIAFKTICAFDTIVIDDFYLVTILGNVLDNAIAAAGKMPKGYINVSIQQMDSFLEIVCENNHCEKIREHNHELLSTKKDVNAFHGIGIKNIRNSVQALNGTMDISYTFSEFTITLLLPNYL